MLSSYNFGISQDTNSTKQAHILITIEDSLRGRSFFGEDSTWINEQLQLHNAPFKKSKITYKLVKIGKRQFTEGPHANYFTKSKPVANFKYGDSAFSVLGQKFYTYIGNSSWGYYPEYHLIRIGKSSVTKNIFNNQTPERYCKHGYDTWRAVPCLTCENELKRISLDTSFRLKIREPNTCEHGWDQLRGLACPQCLHTYRMQYDSSYKKKHFQDSINRMQQILMGGCNHGHICCQTTFCECCPENLRKKNATFEIPVTGSPFCKHDYDQNLGQACPQCIHEDMMSKDSTLKPYRFYFLDSTNKRKTVIQDCAHGHICCEVNCLCCTGGKSMKQIELEVLKLSNCNHSHDCCTFNCECCPTLTKKERRKLIRKKKRTYRRNLRKYKK